MEHSSVRRGQLACCMYALYLHSGHSLYCKKIKYHTIETYIRDMASLIAIATGKDVRKDQPNDTKMGSMLTDVYKEIKRYEALPRKREPFTLEMLKAAKIRAKHARNPLGLDAALADWYEAGLMLGLRLSEYAQPLDAHASINHYSRDIFGNARAFTLTDVEIQACDNQRLKGERCLSLKPHQVSRLWITFRTQKNGRNGERRMFTRNPNVQGHCMIATMYRIMTRFATLLGPANIDVPLACYYSPIHRCARLITATNIQRHIRSLAVDVYHLRPGHDQEELSRWSSHSLRVGGCVLLYTQNFTPPQIMFLLRWESDSFMEYLRNVVPVAIKHYQAVDKAAATPHFL